jgi:hypothetical protein
MRALAWVTVGERKARPYLCGRLANDVNGRL